MKIGRFILIVAILVGLMPGIAQAQGFRWWQDEKLKAELGLSADQIGKLDAVFEELLPRMKAEKGTLDRLESELSRVIRDASVSETEVMRQVEIVEASRSTLGKTRTLMIYRLYRGLTPEQRLKMKALHEKWDEERRKGGRRH